MASGRKRVGAPYGSHTKPRKIGQQQADTKAGKQAGRQAGREACLCRHESRGSNQGAVLLGGRVRSGMRGNNGQRPPGKQHRSKLSC